MAKIAKIAGVFLLCVVAVAAVKVYQRSIPPDEFKSYKGLQGLSPGDPVSVKMERMAEQSAMDAWARFRIHVFIDVKSLPTFERYLGLVAQSPQYKSNPPQEQRAEAIIDGAFVGEAIRRAHGGFWLEKSDNPDLGMFPLNINGNISYPINWCEKRLKDGPDENVYDKYIFFVLGRTNEFHGDMTFWTNTESGLKEMRNVTLK